MKISEAVAQLFLNNARMKHGVPANSDAAAQPEKTLGPNAKTAVTALALFGGFSAADYMGWLPTGQEATEAAPVAEGSDGSLYQYLEDHGYHLPQ